MIEDAEIAEAEEKAYSNSPDYLVERDATVEAPPAVYDPSWDRIKELAHVLETAAKTGAKGILPAGIQNRAQIAVILKMGQEMGLPEMYSLSQISLIQGRPFISSQAMQRMLAERGWIVRWLESTDEKATVQLLRGNFDTLPVTWTQADAKRAGLAGKDNWTKYPRQMLRARALAEAARMHAPEAIGGAYVPDELGEETTEADLLALDS